MKTKEFLKKLKEIFKEENYEDITKIDYTLLSIEELEEYIKELKELRIKHIYNYQFFSNRNDIDILPFIDSLYNIKIAKIEDIIESKKQTKKLELTNSK